MGDDLAIEYVEAIAEFGRRGVERRSGAASGDSGGGGGGGIADDIAVAATDDDTIAAPFSKCLTLLTRLITTCNHDPTVKQAYAKLLGIIELDHPDDNINFMFPAQQLVRYVADWTVHTNPRRASEFPAYLVHSASASMHSHSSGMATTLAGSSITTVTRLEDAPEDMQILLLSLMRLLLRGVGLTAVPHGSSSSSGTSAVTGPPQPLPRFVFSDCMHALLRLFDCPLGGSLFVAVDGVASMVGAGFEKLFMEEPNSEKTEVACAVLCVAMHAPPTHNTIAKSMHAHGIADWLWVQVDAALEACAAVLPATGPLPPQHIMLLLNWYAGCEWGTIDTLPRIEKVLSLLQVAQGGQQGQQELSLLLCVANLGAFLEGRPDLWATMRSCGAAEVLAAVVADMEEAKAGPETMAWYHSIRSGAAGAIMGLLNIRAHVPASGRAGGGHGPPPRLLRLTYAHVRMLEESLFHAVHDRSHGNIIWAPWQPMQSLCALFTSSAATNQHVAWVLGHDTNNTTLSSGGSSAAAVADSRVVFCICFVLAGVCRANNIRDVQRDELYAVALLVALASHAPCALRRRLCHDSAQFESQQQEIEARITALEQEGGVLEGQRILEHSAFLSRRRRQLLRPDECADNPLAKFYDDLTAVARHGLTPESRRLATEAFELLWQQQPQPLPFGTPTYGPFISSYGAAESTEAIVANTSSRSSAAVPLPQQYHVAPPSAAGIATKTLLLMPLRQLSRRALRRGISDAVGLTKKRADEDAAVDALLLRKRTDVAVEMEYDKERNLLLKEAVLQEAKYAPRQYAKVVASLGLGGALGQYVMHRDGWMMMA